jgi:hypothetical protein
MMSSLLAMFRMIGADGREYGPVSVEQLRQWLAEGRATGQTLICGEGTTAWKPLSSFPEFAFSSSPPVISRSVLQPQSQSLKPQTHGMAVAGLVCGILGLFGGLCCFGPALSILGIILSAQARSQISRDPDKFTGAGIATAGFVISIIGVVIYITLFVTWFWFLHPFAPTPFRWHRHWI